MFYGTGLSSSLFFTADTVIVQGIPFNGYAFLLYGIWTHIPVSVTWLVVGGWRWITRNGKGPFTCLLSPPLTKCHSYRVHPSHFVHFSANNSVFYIIFIFPRPGTFFLLIYLSFRCCLLISVATPPLCDPTPTAVSLSRWPVFKTSIEPVRETEIAKIMMYSIWESRTKNPATKFPEVGIIKSLSLWTSLVYDV